MCYLTVPHLPLLTTGAPFLLSFLVAALTHRNAKRFIAYLHALQEKRYSTPPSLDLYHNTLLSESKALYHTLLNRNIYLSSRLDDYNAFIDLIPEMILFFNEKQQVIYQNLAAKLHLNLPEDQPIALHDVFPDPVLLHYFGLLFLNDRFEKGLEVSLPTSPPKTFYVFMKRMLFTLPEGNTPIVIFIAQDITALKKNERMFSDFVVNASHEIRTPLTSIIGLIETLQTTAKNDPEASHEFLELMAKQADYMKSLVNDLLSLSKIEMTLGAPPVEFVNISEILCGSIKKIQWMAKKRNITFETDFKATPAIKGDAHELAQLFVNLFSNSIKYGHNESLIKISVSIMPITDLNIEHLSWVKNVVAIAIEDQSDGIPQKHLSRLTERFYRIDSARSRKAGGTGLGLAIVQQTINRHRGALSIESTPGKGSIFSVYLPIY